MTDTLIEKTIAPTPVFGRPSQSADPSDVARPRPENHGREKILILQSAEPAYVLKAMESLREQSLYQNPSYTVFCRNKQESIGSFQGNLILDRMLVHSETRGSWAHLRNLRRERFDTAVLFLTGDPGYWKVKLFAFLLGAKRKLVFDETGDCFYFGFRRWIRLIARRMRERPPMEAQSRCLNTAFALLFTLLKAIVLPFRFVWLLLIWIRLRQGEWKASGVES
jgi:hypothetical protein